MGNLRIYPVLTPGVQKWGSSCTWLLSSRLKAGTGGSVTTATAASPHSQLPSHLRAGRELTYASRSVAPLSTSEDTPSAPICVSFWLASCQDCALNKHIGSAHASGLKCFTCPSEMTPKSCANTDPWVTFFPLTNSENTKDPS